MKTIKVLGSGCAKCNKTADSIKSIAEELQVPVSVEKESDPQIMMSFGVMSTPAVVVDDKLVHSGSIPHRADIESWLKS